MTYMKLIFEPKLLRIIAIVCASLSLTGCTTAYEEQSYAKKECEELKLAARQQFANYGSNVDGSLDDNNNALGALFQSDENRKKSALRKTYSDRCKG